MNDIRFIIDTVSGDPLLEYFRCQYLVDIIDRLTFREVFMLEDRISILAHRAWDASMNLYWLHHGLWYRAYEHRRALQRYATARIT